MDNYMTPFQQDLLQVKNDFRSLFRKLFCYFFGHKNGPWEKVYTNPYSYMCKCLRCGHYEHK